MESIGSAKALRWESVSICLRNIQEVIVIELRGKAVRGEGS